MSDNKSDLGPRRIRFYGLDEKKSVENERPRECVTQIDNVPFSFLDYEPLNSEPSLNTNVSNDVSHVSASSITNIHDLLLPEKEEDQPQLNNNNNNYYTFIDQFYSKSHANTRLFALEKFGLICRQAKNTHSWVERHNTSRNGNREAKCSEQCIRKSKHNSYLICSVCHLCRHCVMEKRIKCTGSSVVYHQQGGETNNNTSNASSATVPPIKRAPRFGKRLLYDRYQEALYEAFGIALEHQPDLIDKDDTTAAVTYLPKEAICTPPSLDRALGLIDQDRRLIDHGLDERHIEDENLKERAKPYLGMTLMFAAAIYGSYEQLLMLLQMGANSRATDQSGKRVEECIKDDEHKQKLVAFYRRAETVISWSCGVKQWHLFQMNILRIDNLRIRRKYITHDGTLFLRIRCPGAERFEPPTSSVPSGQSTDWSNVNSIQFRANKNIKFMFGNDLILNLYLADSQREAVQISSLRITIEDLFRIRDDYEFDERTVNFELPFSEYLNKGAQLKLRFRGIQHDQKHEDMLKIRHADELQQVLDQFVMPDEKLKKDFASARFNGKTFLHAAIALDNMSLANRLLAMSNGNSSNVVQELEEIVDESDGECTSEPSSVKEVDDNDFDQVDEDRAKIEFVLIFGAKSRQGLFGAGSELKVYQETSKNDNCIKARKFLGNYSTLGQGGAEYEALIISLEKALSIMTSADAKCESLDIIYDSSCSPGIALNHLEEGSCAVSSLLSLFNTARDLIGELQPKMTTFKSQKLGTIDNLIIEAIQQRRTWFSSADDANIEAEKRKERAKRILAVQRRITKEEEKVDSVQEGGESEKKSDRLIDFEIIFDGIVRDGTRGSGAGCIVKFTDPETLKHRSIHMRKYVPSLSPMKQQAEYEAALLGLLKVQKLLQSFQMKCGTLKMWGSGQTVINQLSVGRCKKAILKPSFSVTKGVLSVVAAKESLFTVKISQAVTDLANEAMDEKRNWEAESQAVVDNQDGARDLNNNDRSVKPISFELVFGGGVNEAAKIGGCATRLNYDDPSSGRTKSIKMRSFISKEDASLDDASYSGLIAGLKEVVLITENKSCPCGTLNIIGGSPGTNTVESQLRSNTCSEESPLHDGFKSAKQIIESIGAQNITYSHRRNSAIEILVADAIEKKKNLKSIDDADLTNDGFYFYAVRIGEKPGIYHSLEDAMEQMKGFEEPELTVFKTLSEAEEYLNAKELKESELTAKRKTGSIEFNIYFHAGWRRSQRRAAACCELFFFDTDLKPHTFRMVQYLEGIYSYEEVGHTAVQLGLSRSFDYLSSKGFKTCSLKLYSDMSQFLDRLKKKECAEVDVNKLLTALNPTVTNTHTFERGENPLAPMANLAMDLKRSWETEFETKSVDKPVVKSVKRKPQFEETDIQRLKQKVI